jgi:hypothetical protein
MDPSSKGRLTCLKSQSHTPSPHPTGAAATPSITTPSHRTDRPWNEVTKGGSTPRDAALASPQLDHPFESANQFTRLRSTDDDASDDGSRRSTELLTPGDLAHREDVAFSPGFDGDLLPQPAGDILTPLANDAQGSTFSPGFDEDIPTPPAGDILAPPAAAAKGSFSTLEDLVWANAAGIAELVDKHRSQLGYYDRSSLVGFYVYLQKCMTGSTVSAYGDIRRTNPPPSLPHIRLLTYGRLDWGLNPVPMVGGWRVDGSRFPVCIPCRTEAGFEPGPPPL